MSVSNLNVFGFIFVPSKSNSCNCLKLETKVEKLNTLFLIALVFTGLVLGCGTSQKLEEYPYREIDRPYTLPKGVNRLDTTTYIGQINNRGDTEDLFQVPLPTFVETGISDKSSLPLLGYRFQFFHNSLHTFGFQTLFNLYLGYNIGAVAFFDLSTYYRFRVTDFLSFNLDTYRKPLFYVGDDLGSITSISFYPLLQVTDRVALGASIQHRITRQVYASIYLMPQQYFSSDSDRFSATDITHPTSVFVMWNFHRRWDLAAEYSWTPIRGEAIDFKLGLLRLSYYWGSEEKKKDDDEREKDKPAS